MNIYRPYAFCVYLTIYHGNKFPMFYIGSTSISKIQRGYHGSVASKEYKQLWYSEIRNNPTLFTTKIISRHPSRKDAYNKEEKLQRALNSHKSSMYVNKGLANHKHNNFGRHGRPSDDTIQKLKNSDYATNDARKLEAAEKQRITKRSKSTAEQARLSLAQSERSLRFYKNMSDETKRVKSEKISAANKIRPAEVNVKISESITKIQATRSDEDWQKIADKKKLTWENRKTAGIKRRPAAHKILVTCLCCRREYDPGNFYRHIRKLQR